MTSLHWCGIRNWLLNNACTHIDKKDKKMVSTTIEQASRRSLLNVYLVAIVSKY